MTEASARLLALVKRAGLEEELTQRVFNENQQRREELLVELAALPGRDKVLAPMQKEVARATSALRAAERAVLLAQQEYDTALARVVIVGRELDGRVDALTGELESTAPECLNDAYQRIALMRSNLRHCDLAGTDEITSIQDQLDGMLDELHGLMRRADMTLPKLEQRAAELLRTARQMAEPLLRDAPDDVYRRSRDALFPPLQKSA